MPLRGFTCMAQLVILPSGMKKQKGINQMIDPFF